MIRVRKDAFRYERFSMKRFLSTPAVDLSRRRFVHGLALGGVVAGLGTWSSPGARAQATPAYPETLQGTEFDLSIAEMYSKMAGDQHAWVALASARPRR